MGYGVIMFFLPKSLSYILCFSFQVVNYVISYTKTFKKIRNIQKQAPFGMTQSKRINPKI